MAPIMPVETTVVGPTPSNLYSSTETYSKNVLGPVFFTLSNLRVLGSAGEPMLPEFVAPGQSPYIIASDEVFYASVDIEFNKSPLSELLLCLGTKVKITYAFEGIGGRANEIDVDAEITTVKGQFKYTVTFAGEPSKIHPEPLKPGFYGIAAVATVGPSDHPCAQYIFGYGYIAKALLQVY